MIIVSVLLRFLDNIGRDEVKPSVWKGAFLGLFIAASTGVGFIIAFYETGKAAFTGDTEFVVEGVLVRAENSLSE